MEIIKKFRLSKMLNNCYLIKEVNKVILIDAPDDITKVINYLEENSMELDQVWLTHCHFDHILGLNHLKDKFSNLEVYIAKEEIGGINNKKENLFEPFGINSNFRYEGDLKDSRDLLNQFTDLKLIFVSGHSLNSTCYYFLKDDTLFSGDVLFRETVGRSDLIYGNTSKLLNSIKEDLYSLPDQTQVYSGHGFATSIGYEKINNKVINGQSNNIL